MLKKSREVRLGLEKPVERSGKIRDGGLEDLSSKVIETFREA